jgi:hypothetical protein
MVALDPEQMGVTGVTERVRVNAADGAMTATVEVLVHPLASVTVTTYVPVDRPVAVGPV